jgi:pyruvate dehydrogenase E1 component alpha subunit
MRTYDERSLVYHRHGRIGTYAIFWGHEAMQVGAVSAMDDDDWILPSYRESAVGLMRGIDASTILAWWRGHPRGWWDPRDTKVASVSIPVGSHVPHAVGVAWGERLQGHNRASLAFFGDGATSEGDVHEGLNFAAVLELPVVLLCNNNQWAITTPISKQTKARQLADKAVGYGMASTRVDGNDVLAVYEAVHQAAAHGRAGNGPTFIECVSYRPHLHATADDPTTYRDDAEASRARENDCVTRFEKYMLRAGLVTEQDVSQMREAALAIMAEAIAAAEALPAGTVDDLLGTTYAIEPPSFARDRADIAALSGGAH